MVELLEFKHLTAWHIDAVSAPAPAIAGRNQRFKGQRTGSRMPAVHRAIGEAAQRARGVLGLHQVPGVQAPDDNGKPGSRATQLEPRQQPVPTPTQKTYLDVPFDDKDKAKKAGARWDSEQKKWFAETSDKDQLKPFEKWLVKKK